MLSLLVFLHVEYLLSLFHSLLLHLLELLDLLRGLLLAQGGLELGLKLWFDDGGCRVTQGHRHYLVGRFCLILSLRFGVLSWFLLKIFEWEWLCLRLYRDCFCQISLTVRIGTKYAFSATSYWCDHILFIEKEWHFSWRGYWLNDLRIYFLPPSHHHVTDRVELDMTIIIWERDHLSKQWHLLLYLLLLHLPL